MRKRWLAIDAVEVICSLTSCVARCAQKKTGGQGRADAAVVDSLCDFIGTFFTKRRLFSKKRSSGHNRQGLAVNGQKSYAEAVSVGKDVWTTDVSLCGTCCV